MRQYYIDLEIDDTATPEQIKSAFHKKAKETHPDMGGDPEKFKTINQAYIILSDVGKRARYGNGENFDSNQVGTEDRARDIIKAYFATFIENIENIEDCNTVTEFVSNNVNEQLSNMRNFKRTLNVKLKKLKKRLGKSKAKQGENIFELMLQNKIRTLENNLESAEKDTEVFLKVFELLKNYEEEVDPQDLITNPITFTWSSSNQPFRPSWM